MTQTIQCEAILFDLDGVLVDSTEAVERSWREWATRAGLDPDETMDQIHGRRARDIIAEFAPHLDVDAEGDRLLQLEIDYVGLCAPFAGAHELFAALNNHPFAVVTSGEYLLASGRLRHIGLPLPPVLVTADDVTEGKPDPEGYLKAARQLGKAPAACVVIEDAPAGLQAAQAGGMRSIGVATSYPPGALSAADLVIPALDRLQLTTNGAQILLTAD